MQWYSVAASVSCPQRIQLRSVGCVPASTTMVCSTAVYASSTSGSARRMDVPRQRWPFAGERPSPEFRLHLLQQAGSLRVSERVEREALAFRHKVGGVVMPTSNCYSIRRVDGTPANGFPC
jgi:hypothetical protein